MLHSVNSIHVLMASPHICSPVATPPPPHQLIEVLTKSGLHIAILSDDPAQAEQEKLVIVVKELSKHLLRCVACACHPHPPVFWALR